MEKNNCPLVSVVIPVYNVEPWLRECLDSVLGQTLHDTEIICVNDGSTDHSLLILEEYAGRDDRIRIIDQKNSGLSEARNSGAKAATGKYLYFLDSDDLLDRSALELCAARMERDNLEYLCFNAVAFGESRDSAITAGNKNHYYYKRTLDEEKVFTGQELFVRLKQENTYVASAWACMLLRTVFTEMDLRFHPSILHEDEPWTFTLLMTLSRCGCLNKTFYYRRIHDGSITQSGMTFAHVYGRFAGYLDARRLVDDRPDLISSPETLEAVRSHLERMQEKTIRKYLDCNEEEKLKRSRMNPEEYAEFERTIVAPASARSKNPDDKQRRADSADEKGRAADADSPPAQKAVSVPGKLKNRLAKIPALRKAARKLRRIRSAGKRPDRTVWLFGTPNHNNIGDLCIAEAEIEYLREMLPGARIAEVGMNELVEKEYSQLEDVAPSVPVFFHGGGNLGTLWPKSEIVREKMLRRLKRNPVIIFPQSICFSDDEAGKEALARARAAYRGDNILLCCRDRVSWMFAQEHFGCPSVLVPDMVMRKAMKAEKPLERYGVMTLFRHDMERRITDEDTSEIETILAEKFQSIEITDMIQGRGITTALKRRRKTDKLIRHIRSVECVVTDRLHGMILCAVTGTPCVVFGNSYHKVESCHEWLKDLGYIRFIRSTKELRTAVDQVCSCTEREYPEQQLQSRFQTLTDYLGRFRNSFS